MVKSRHQRKHKSKTHKTRKHHRGGSQASDLVDGFVKEEGQYMPVPETPRLPGNPASLNLYQTTGGGCGCSGGAPKRMAGGSPASDYVMQRAQYVLDEATKLGDSLSHLIKLEKLSFGNNFNQPFGDSLSKLINLKELYLSELFDQPLDDSLKSITIFE